MNFFNKNYSFTKKPLNIQKKGIELNGKKYNILKISKANQYYFKRLKLKKIISNEEIINNILSIVCVSENEKEILKIEINSNQLKKNSLEEEFAILTYLKNEGCISVPNVLESGLIDSNVLKRQLNKINEDFISNKHEFFYYTQEYIEDTQRFNLSDVILSILEQRSFGVFQNDIKPDNIIKDKLGNLYLIDFDQAIYINKVNSLNSKQFIDWTLNKDYEYYRLSKKGWLRNFKYCFKSYHLNHLFKNGSFNLINTSYYLKQASTNSKLRAYHTLENDKVFVNGIRDIKDRVGILENINFDNNEKVLDVGCNIGLLSHYLSYRCKSITGVDMDLMVINCAKLLTNILGFKNLNFKYLDLDKNSINEKYDTVMLFSVIHHTNKLEENCIKISKITKRIIIECRLKERGKKPQLLNNKITWVETSKWNFTTLKELYIFLENLFPGFHFVNNHGSCDKDRFIIELSKNENSS